jgi:hypothetical protein
LPEDPDIPDLTVKLANANICSSRYKVPLWGFREISEQKRGAPKVAFVSPVPLRALPFFVATFPLREFVKTPSSIFMFNSVRPQISLTCRQPKQI